MASILVAHDCELAQQLSIWADALDEGKTYCEARANVRSVVAANVATAARAKSAVRSRLPTGSQLPEALPECPVIPRWVGDIPSTHDLRWVGGIAGCVRCGGMSAGRTDKATLLAGPCRGTQPTGSASRVRAFALGLLPQPFRAWPDERTAPDVRHAHISLVWANGSWRAVQ